MRMNGTKYEHIDKLPKSARPVSVFAAENGIANSPYVQIKYDRFIKGKGKDPGYSIKCYQGSNWVIPN